MRKWLIDTVFTYGIPYWLIFERHVNTGEGFIVNCLHKSSRPFVAIERRVGQKAMMKSVSNSNWKFVCINSLTDFPI